VTSRQIVYKGVRLCWPSHRAEEASAAVVGIRLVRGGSVVALDVRTGTSLAQDTWCRYWWHHGVNSGGRHRDSNAGIDPTPEFGLCWHRQQHSVPVTGKPAFATTQQPNCTDPKGHFDSVGRSIGHRTDQMGQMDMYTRRGTGTCIEKTRRRNHRTRTGAELPGPGWTDFRVRREWSQPVLGRERRSRR